MGISCFTWLIAPAEDKTAMNSYNRRYSSGTAGGNVIELSTLINDLRDELERSVATAEGRAVQFELESVELEVEVAVEHTGEGGGKVRFWVAEIGAQAALNHGSTQRVKLALKPSMEVDGVRTTPLVSGDAGANEE
jgi:Trypsin-co-occurring domain 2